MIIKDVVPDDLIDQAIWVLQECTRGQKVYGAFSGGKDSVALKEVCRIADIDLEWHYHKSTIDPPEVCQFIRKHHPDVIWDRPKMGNFFRHAHQRGVLPSFKRRWCCYYYKEFRGPKDIVWVTGVRREESITRAADAIVGMHRNTRRVHIRPLANWDSEYLWDFIRSRKLAVPSLYNEGFTRLGCVGCPLASRKNKEREFKRWPRIANKWMKLARYCYEKNAPWRFFKSFDEYLEAWLSRRI